MAKKKKQARKKSRDPKERRSDPMQAALLLSIPAAAVVLAALVLAGYAGWFTSSDNLPDLQEIESQNFELTLATVAYTADGKELGRYGRQNRTWVSYDSLPDHVIHALVATEDRRFWRHWGIDVWRTFSAATQTILGKIGLPFEQQGGSTITQQLARNLYNRQIGFEVSVARKLKEMAAAVQLERRYAKEEVIEMYLNTVPFRHNAFGIEGAARTYFGKATTGLDTLEAAALIGMLKASTRYDPVRNPENSRNRRNTVLRQMINQDFLDREFYDAHQEMLTPTSLRTADVTDSFAPYAAEYVRQRVQAWGDSTGYDVYEDGLVVHTTIDSRVQVKADSAVTQTLDALQAVADCEWSAPRSKRLDFLEELDKYLADACHRDPRQRFAYFWERHPAELDAFIRESQRYRRLRRGGTSATDAAARLRRNEAFMDSLKSAKTRMETGLIAIDPRSGFVKAWVGGRDLTTEWYDHVATARRQPGSTFKPLLYASAIQTGWSPDAQYLDSVFSYFVPGSNDTWAPQNSGGSASLEHYSLREALSRSLNTISAQLIHELGPEQVIQFARGMGIESALEAVPSLALGTSDVTLLELTTAYSTLANLGTRLDPVVVTRIEDQHGTPLFEYRPEPKVELVRETAEVIVDMMRDVIDQPYGTGFRIRWQYGQHGYDFAGKTGTTQEGADGWFMLMHPELVTGSWVGFNDRRVTFRSTFWGQGAHNALFVVGDFLTRINANPLVALNPHAEFPTPLSTEAEGTPHDATDHFEY